MSLVNTETGEIAGAANYDVHPAATLFPLIEGEAFRSLVEDIRTRGQEVPVVLDVDGRLLDGRNRARACQAIGIDVKETRYSGDDPYGFVVSHNMHRRHLTESQRAMVAAKLANLRNGRPSAETLSIDRDSPSPITTKAAAKSLNVGEASAHRARSIRDHGTPELIHAVEVGEISVNKASEIVAAAEKNPIRVAEIHADHKAGKSTPKPTRRNKPPTPTKYGNRKKHVAVIDSIATAASGLAIAADEITSLDQSVTDGEAARLADDLSKSIRSLNRIKTLLKERTS